jgi:hypothetical protein
MQLRDITPTTERVGVRVEIFTERQFSEALLFSVPSFAVASISTHPSTMYAPGEAR